MAEKIPAQPNIYHIVHVDRLPSIIAAGRLFCDAHMSGSADTGTMIGAASIKERRLRRPVGCHIKLMVGDCVPFYFCSRSVMLYMIHKANDDRLAYRGGQQEIVHLVAKMDEAIDWAASSNKRWACSTINAAHGAADYFCDRGELHRLDWEAIRSKYWSGCRDEKQAEFLLEDEFPWELITGIGVFSQPVAQRVADASKQASHRPPVQIKPDWYY